MRRRFVAACGAVLAIGLPPWGATAADGAKSIERFALVIGDNAPLHDGLPTLRYADDDAIRWTILLRTFGAEVELLTTPDAQSQRLYGADLPEHHKPTHGELDTAMARLAAAIKGAHAAGHQTAFFFVYAGHGDVEGGEGAIALEDGPFFRHDLENSVLAVSPADTNHVIVDACRSAYMAFDRGPGGERRPWTQPYFGSGTAARFPNTGFLLANSSDGASHEWEEFQAGIFSHELRSGLLGGADADGDGLVTYRELLAFVRVANQAVRNDKFRPDILAQAPRSGTDVLVARSSGLGGRVHFSGRTGRHVLEDELGIRWADAHPGLRQDLTLLLPQRSASESLFLRTNDGGTEYPLDPAAQAELTDVAARPPGVLRRGALHEAFALLFTSPFDLTAVVATTETQPDAGVTLSKEGGESRGFDLRKKRIAAASLAAASAAALVGSGVLLWRTEQVRSDASSGNARMSFNSEVGTLNGWTTALAVSGGILAAAATALYLWSRRGETTAAPTVE
jgi:hypothetical protein